MTKEEARERGRKGGLKSGYKRKEIKALKEIIIERLSKIEKKSGGTVKEALITKLVDRLIENKESMSDIVKGLEFLADYSGEQPKQKIEHSVDNSTILAAESILEKVKNGK